MSRCQRPSPTCPHSRSTSATSWRDEEVRPALRLQRHGQDAAVHGVQGPRQAQETATTRDTLYFNAFTEDLFYWDNDLENDRERVLKINTDSTLLRGPGRAGDGQPHPPAARPLRRLRLPTSTRHEWEVSFSREVTAERRRARTDESEEDIKVSRGEENIFIWCFFLAIVQLVLDGAEAYKWVKYVYIDDPISSLDEHNAIVGGAIIWRSCSKDAATRRKTVVSSHHTLFFNVLCNELKKAHASTS